MNPKTPFKRVFMDIITYLSSRGITEETTFTKDILIVDAYSSIRKIME